MCTCMLDGELSPMGEIWWKNKLDNYWGENCSSQAKSSQITANSDHIWYFSPAFNEFKKINFEITVFEIKSLPYEIVKLIHCFAVFGFIAAVNTIWQK